MENKFQLLPYCIILILALPITAAYAQDGQPIAMKVPWRDVQSASRDGVQSLAAIVSNKAQTIIVYAPTREIWDAVIAGARVQLLNGKSYMKGVLLASGVRSEIAFYADAQLTETILRPDVKTLTNTVTQIIERDYIEFDRKYEHE